VNLVGGSWWQLVGELETINTLIVFIVSTSISGVECQVEKLENCES
jgi:hypothetical protein